MPKKQSVILQETRAKDKLTIVIPKKKNMCHLVTYQMNKLQQRTCYKKSTYKRPIFHPEWLKGNKKNYYRIGGGWASFLHFKMLWVAFCNWIKSWGWRLQMNLHEPHSNMKYAKLSNMYDNVYFQQIGINVYLSNKSGSMLQVFSCATAFYNQAHIFLYNFEK